MNDNKIKILIYLCILAVFVGIASVVMILTNRAENPNDIHEPIRDNYNFSDIYDINEYQTVYNCIRNYYSTLNSESDMLLNLLYEDYKSKNRIDISNVSNFVEKKYDSFNYVINQIKKYSNVYFSIYYIIGDYSLEALDESLEKIIVKDIMIEDIVNGTYAILPILSTNVSFDDAINKYELTSFNKKIIKNENNELISGAMSDFNEAMLYFSDFINNLKNYCSDAYLLLGDNTTKVYSNLNKFQDVCNKFQISYVSPTIVNYGTSYEDGKKNIKITDNYSNKYNFIISSVKNYLVDISVK